jgi:hypothetical protein
MTATKANKAPKGSRFMKECDSKRIESIFVYSPKLAAGTAKRNIRFYNIIFLVLYVYQVGWALTTIGEPYRKFLEKADREGFQGTNKTDGALRSLTERSESGAQRLTIRLFVLSFVSLTHLSHISHTLHSYNNNNNNNNNYISHGRSHQDASRTRTLARRH